MLDKLGAEDGRIVGAEEGGTEGKLVGLKVGFDETVGEIDGVEVGCLDGVDVGSSVGFTEACLDGDIVGFDEIDGEDEGIAVVGEAVGAFVGSDEGYAVGELHVLPNVSQTLSALEIPWQPSLSQTELL